MRKKTIFLNSLHELEKEFWTNILGRTFVISIVNRTQRLTSIAWANMGHGPYQLFLFLVRLFSIVEIMCIGKIVHSNRQEYI